MNRQREEISEIQKFKNYENMLKTLDSDYKEGKDVKDKKSKSKKDKGKKSSKSRPRKGNFWLHFFDLEEREDKQVLEQEIAKNAQVSVKISNVKEIKMLSFIQQSLENMMKMYGSVNVKLKLKDQDPTFTGSEVLQRLGDMIENNAYVPRQVKPKSTSDEIGSYRSQINHNLGTNINVQVPPTKNQGVDPKDTKRSETPSRPPKIPQYQNQIQTKIIGNQEHTSEIEQENRAKYTDLANQILKSQEEPYSEKNLSTQRRSHDSAIKVTIKAEAQSTGKQGYPSQSDEYQGMIDPNLSDTRRNFFQPEQKLIKLASDQIGTPSRGVVTSTRRLVIGHNQGLDIQDSENVQVHSLQHNSGSKPNGQVHSSGHKKDQQNDYDSNFMDLTPEKIFSSEQKSKQLSHHNLQQNYNVDLPPQQLKINQSDQELISQARNHSETFYPQITRTVQPSKNLTDSGYLIRLDQSKSEFDRSSNHQGSRTKIDPDSQHREDISPLFQLKTPIQQAYENQRGVKLNINNTYLKSIQQPYEEKRESKPHLATNNNVYQTLGNPPVTTASVLYSSNKMIKTAPQIITHRRESNFSIQENSTYPNSGYTSLTDATYSRMINVSGQQKNNPSQQPYPNHLSFNDSSQKSGILNAQMVQRVAETNHQPAYATNNSHARDGRNVVTTSLRRNSVTPRLVHKDTNQSGFEQTTQEKSTPQSISVLIRGTSRDPSERKLNLNTSNQYRQSSNNKFSSKELTQSVKQDSKISIHGLPESRNVYAHQSFASRDNSRSPIQNAVRSEHVEHQHPQYTHPLSINNDRPNSSHIQNSIYQSLTISS